VPDSHPCECDLENRSRLFKLISSKKAQANGFCYPDAKFKIHLQTFFSSRKQIISTVSVTDRQAGRQHSLSSNTHKILEQVKILQTRNNYIFLSFAA